MFLNIFLGILALYAFCVITTKLYVWGVRNGIRHSLLILDLDDDQIEILNNAVNSKGRVLTRATMDHLIKKGEEAELRIKERAENKIKEPENSLLN